MSCYRLMTTTQPTNSYENNQLHLFVSEGKSFMQALFSNMMDNNIAMRIQE